MSRSPLIDPFLDDVITTEDTEFLVIELKSTEEGVFITTLIHYTKAEGAMTFHTLPLARWVNYWVEYKGSISWEFMR